MSTGKFLSDSAQVLPCVLEELGCETTSLDPYAYIWAYPDNCVLSVLRTEEVNMVRQGTKYFFIIGPDSTNKFVFEVKNNPQKHCGKPTVFYPNNYDSLYVAISVEASSCDPDGILVKNGMVPPNSYSIKHPLRTTDLPNCLHMIPNTHPIKQAMKTFI